MNGKKYIKILVFLLLSFIFWNERSYVTPLSYFAFTGVWIVYLIIGILKPKQNISAVIPVLISILILIWNIVGNIS